jgi:tRNA1(Val) A37 N6-methylase TrmN6
MAMSVEVTRNANSDLPPDLPPATVNRVLDGRVAIAQPAAGYRVAIDPVLLAAAVDAAPGERILDLGCGVGTAALCLVARLPGVAVVGLEKEPVFAAFAMANARRNSAAGRVDIFCGDLLAPPEALQPAGFDQVMANPPYLKRGTATVSGHPLKAAATMEGRAGLGDWVDCAARFLRAGGRLTLIHRADRLPDLLAALAGGFGDIRVLPLLPKAGAAPKRILIRAVRAAAAGLVEVPGLVLHDAAGTFTPEAAAILRAGRGLSI